eukprot:15448068-Alexandrium_andersonii.AAC.1
MIEETWASPEAGRGGRPDRPGAVGPRGANRWNHRVLRALVSACGLDGAPQDPLAEVRPRHLPGPDRGARPSSNEIRNKYGRALEDQIAQVQHILDQG